MFNREPGQIVVRTTAILPVVWPYGQVLGRRCEKFGSETTRYENVSF